MAGFDSLRNIQTSWQMVRVIMFTTIACSAIVVLVVVNWAFERSAREREKIYVLDEKGKSLMLALSQNVEENRPVEARSHIRTFHELFFSLSPDADAINSNIKRALALADRSAYTYYNDLQETGYYSRVISANVIQKIVVDSMDIDYDFYPLRVMCYSTQTISRQSNVTTRSLVTSCELENTVRSDNNPQGFLISGFKVLRNEDISKNRN